MLIYDEKELVHIFFYKFSFLFQGKERPAKTKLMPAKLVMPAKLHAVLVCTKSDSAQH